MPSPSSSFAKVVVPMDLSEHSLAALEQAAVLAATPAALRIVHVLPELDPASPGAIWGDIKDEDRRAHAEKAFREGLPEAFRTTPVEVRIGGAVHEIVTYAEEEAASLVVLGSHGRTGLSRVLLGSIAENVVRRAPCSVLVVRK